MIHCSCCPAFQFPKQENNREEVNFFFIPSKFDVSHFVYRTQCHFGANIISKVISGREKQNFVQIKKKK